MWFVSFVSIYVNLTIVYTENLSKKAKQNELLKRNLFPVISIWYICISYIIGILFDQVMLALQMNNFVLYSYLVLQFRNVINFRLY